MRKVPQDKMIKVADSSMMAAIPIIIDEYEDPGAIMTSQLPVHANDHGIPVWPGDHPYWI